MLDLQIRLAVEVGSLDVAESFRFGRGEQQNICRDEVVVLETDNLSNLDIAPLAFFEGIRRRQDFGFARVEFRVGRVSFLCIYGEHESPER